MTAHRQSLGRFGEDRAARWYIERGYRVLERNWRCAEGELDLIVTDGTNLVVCEVKTRSTDRFGTGFEAITPRKQQRVRRLAARYLRQGPGWAEPVRFDAASVLSGKVEVIEGAF